MNIGSAENHTHNSGDEPSGGGRRKIKGSSPLSIFGIPAKNKIITMKRRYETKGRNVPHLTFPAS
jgi:hypothetical protein